MRSIILTITSISATERSIKQGYKNLDKTMLLPNPNPSHTHRGYTAIAYVLIDIIGIDLMNPVVA